MKPSPDHHPDPKRPAKLNAMKIVLVAASQVSKEKGEILMGVATRVGRMTVMLYFN